MKQATGELNATVIVVVAIGVLSAFFFTVLWPQMRANHIRNTKCSEAICGKTANSDGRVECRYKDVTLTCPYKG